MAQDPVMRELEDYDGALDTLRDQLELLILHLNAIDRTFWPQMLLSEEDATKHFKQRLSREFPSLRKNLRKLIYYMLDSFPEFREMVESALGRVTPK